MNLTKTQILRMIVKQRRNIQFYNERIEIQKSADFVTHHYLGHAIKKYSQLDIDRCEEIIEKSVSHIKNGNYKDLTKERNIKRQIKSSKERKENISGFAEITLPIFKHIVFMLNCNAVEKYTHKEVFQVIKNNHEKFSKDVASLMKSV